MLLASGNNQNTWEHKLSFLIRKELLMKVRKKPIIVEAYQTDEELDIETLEGTMHASVGDFIITGVHGEQYPCKPDIFYETYEVLE